MIADLNEASSEVIAFLHSLRMSVDRTFGRPQILSGLYDRDKVTRTLVSIEEARIRFRTLIRIKYKPSAEDWIRACDELEEFIEMFLNSTAIDRNVLGLPFRSSVPRDRITPFQQFLRDHDLTVEMALQEFSSFVNSMRYFEEEQVALTFQDLARIVPQQQVAPVTFAIHDGRIVISDRAPKTNPDDRENISHALAHIASSGERLIDNLQQSNCDRRLLENFKDLHSQIVSGGNIVRIGLSNLACGVMCAQFAEEMPNALNAMINSYSAAISLYVGQFPEWEKFTQNAAAIELDQQDIDEIAHAADAVVKSLEDDSSLADPEVSRTIKFLRELISRPGNSAKRAAFAVMRTIENLVSSVVRFSLSVLNKTAEKSAEKISTVATHVIVGLLGIALLGATGMGGPSAIAGTPWVKQAAEIVQAQIEALSRTPPPS